MGTVTINGVERYTGLIPSSAESIARMHREGILKYSHDHRFFAGRTADWMEASCEHFWNYRKDQDGLGACVGFSGSHALDIAFAREGFNVNSSPAAIYSAINGGSDNGAMCSDCYDLLIKCGAFPSGEGRIGDLDWKTAYKSKWWQNPTSTLGKQALRFRVIEAVFCSSLDDWLAGLQSGQWSGQCAMGASNSFDTDSNGWLPKCDGTILNHALCATGGMKRHPKTGNWGFEGANSWGTSWGVKGLFYAEAKDWLDRPYQELWLIRQTAIPA